MRNTIQKLESIFRQMVENYSTMGESWKNLTLGREAFNLMLSLPDTFPGEYDTPADKADLLGQMLDRIIETEAPRFCISVREEMQRLNPSDSENEHSLAILHDYINPAISMEDFCKCHRRHLKFDPVERTEEYEKLIPYVESEISKELKDHPRGMGFCFAYWSAKRAAFARRGIDWKSPAFMNPGVMFD